MKPDSAVRTVLVVDDSEFFRNQLIEFLSLQQGWRVVGEAGNGAEAIMLARTLRPDLVLMDIHMPVMDGIEATTFIKKSVSRRIKVVLLSMYESSAGLHLPRTLADAYIPKQKIKRELPRMLKRGKGRGYDDGARAR